MKKLVLLSTLCALVISHLDASNNFVLSRFKVVDAKTGLASNKLTLSADIRPRAIYIIMPDAPTPIFLRGKSEASVGFANQDMKFFLSDQPILNNSIVLVLDWLDAMQKSETDKIVSEAGTEMKSIISNLDTYYPRMDYNLIGLGRGGVVAAGIVNQENLPKQVTLMLLGVPFIQDATKHPMYANLNPRNIDAAYVFYNNMPYRGSALLPASTNRPAQAPANKTYFIRLIANNKEQLPHKISFLKLQDVLNACATAREQYAAHKELWASLSNIKPETHGLVGIVKASPSTNSAQVATEQIQSSKAIAKYKKNWGSTSILSKSDTTPIRSSYKLETPKPSQKLASKPA